MRRPFPSARSLALAVLVTAASTSSPQAAKAQWVVWDPGNFAQAVVDHTMRGLEYATQGLQYVEQLQMVQNLIRQVQQLDDQIEHLRDAANGRVGQLTQAFSALSSADASLLLDADFGAWRNRLTGTSNDLLNALQAMEDANLADYLLNELDAADIIGEADLRVLYPGVVGDQLADDWVEGRELGDRMRAADFAAAEAAGRVTTLLREAQTDIDGRRGQGELSHTALQQAQVANQLTATEIDIALAQLIAVQAQQDALQRHEAELAERARLQRWVQREQLAQARLQSYLQAEEQRRGAWRTALRLVP